MESLDAEELTRLFAHHMNNDNRLAAAHYIYEQDLLPDFKSSFENIFRACKEAWTDLNIPTRDLGNLLALLLEKSGGMRRRAA